jgi:EAL domain-containing protein (putative c-di-GMP-specific phosphodiesterase class I)
MNVMAKRQLDIDLSLHHALNRMEFVLHYQPQVDNFGKIIGAEALLRWHSSVLGNVSPAEFIPQAEGSGAILSIGEWVIRTACLEMRDWLDKGVCAESCYIAINVSPCQLKQSDFVERITAIVREVGIHPHQIDIELTEGVLMWDTEDAKQKLFELKEQGFRISVDDFGTGYSSLAYLKHFPIDVLKIDRFFVQDIGFSHRDEAISRAIINLAISLGIKTVAEGVETISQVQFLQSHGCEAYQGYYFSEPVSALKMASLLQR